MRIACWITKDTNTNTHTHRICNTHSFSTTTMAARTHLNVTLYVHCLSCSRPSRVRDNLVEKLKWSVVKASCFVPGGSQVFISYGINSGTAVLGVRNLVSFPDEVRTCIEKLRYATQVSYSPVEMWWHSVTHGRGSKGETGEWSG
jgi:hypothetical protein